MNKTSIGNDKVQTKFCNVMYSTPYHTFIKKPNNKKVDIFCPVLLISGYIWIIAGQKMKNCLQFITQILVEQ